MDRPRLLAFYLPQFHPIPENDAWWGKGFTEWTNAAKAKPLFPGHYQPHLPADLGFYDLRVPETREAQAALARDYGITGFCYYHYWFGGRQLLNRPFDEVLASGQPDFPFCLCWANESWTGVWHGAPRRMLIEQTYPGEADHEQHFKALLPAFTDPRYIKVEGKPLFSIYKPDDLPNPRQVIAQWQAMAVAAGLPGLYFVGVTWDFDWDPAAHGFDAAVLQRLAPSWPWHSAKGIKKLVSHSIARLLRWPSIYSYAEVANHLLPENLTARNRFPCVVPNWDNTPRSGSRGLVLKGSTPALFRHHFQQALALTRHVPAEHRFIFIKSWNEWAEGNHIEPDLKYGKAYLDVIRSELENTRNDE